jgi:asparagine synthase (glutamine-hydrolysing)
MCGIAGSSNTWNPGLLENMEESMRHRGPDGGGFVNDELDVLVARRLAIVDLEGGDQPMTSPSGRSSIVFNG